MQRLVIYTSLVIFLVICFCAGLAFSNIEGSAYFTWDAPTLTDNLWGYRIVMYTGEYDNDPKIILKYDITKSHYLYDIPKDMVVNFRVHSLYSAVAPNGDIFVKQYAFTELLDIPLLEGKNNPPINMSFN